MGAKSEDGRAGGCDDRAVPTATTTAVTGTVNDQMTEMCPIFIFILDTSSSLCFRFCSALPPRALPSKFASIIHQPPRYTSRGRSIQWAGCWLWRPSSCQHAQENDRSIARNCGCACKMRIQNSTYICQLDKSEKIPCTQHFIVAISPSWASEAKICL